jgi:hypothetical protein
MRLIETTHLKTWAGSKLAESRFPYIVKALISAVIQPEKLRMPFGDAVWVPGADGVVVNGEENRFVPIGLSVWELGTGARVKSKADGDYKKRSRDKAKDGKERKAVQKLDRPQTTFVFVTPRVWKYKDDWVTERKAENIWKDVVVIDGVDLQDWLEAAPAVNLQFAAELGIVPEAGLQTPEQAWEEWSHLTDPPTSEELAVVGREDQEKEILGRLIAPPSTFTIRGDSPREAWGFTLAALRRIGSEEKRLSLYARTIIADNEKVASRLRNLNNLLIVLRQTHGPVSGFLSSRGCHVVVPEGNDAYSERNVIILARPTHRLFTEALAKMGLREDEAERAARACGLSVTILQRQRAHANFERPRWSDEENVAQMLPALLAGRWNDRSEADRDILCQLAGVADYATVASELQRFLWVDEPPLRKIDEMWTLIAPADAFQLIARGLTTANLDRFKNAFREVFGRIDPKVEIPPDEWLYYDIKGERGHSGWLRSGMAETLLLIAERGTDARLVCVQSPRAYAEEVVRGLPGLNDDWRVLASLRDQYARLMEAAPDPFLDSLERLLEANPDDLRCLFAEGELFGGGSMHTGLLWGLETMAWSPDYLPRIAIILSRLASLDPGGRTLNRPINSLGEIFLWWHHGTNASLDQRLAAIDLVLAREPDVGWALLAKLLPGAHSTSIGTAKPRWRDFGDPPEDTCSRRGQIRYLSAIVDRALDHLGIAPERWRAILDSLRILSPIQQEKALDLLDAIARGATAVDVKTALWEMLRDFTYQHQTFRDANWALKGELIDRLEASLSHLAPDNLVERNRWLFDEWLPELPSGEQDIERREKEVEVLRQQAVAEILQAQGTEGVVMLGTTCKYPGSVASVAVPLMTDLGAIHGLVEQAISAGEAGVFLAGQISGRSQQLHGEAWRNLIYKQAQAGSWPPAVIASLLVWWPDERATWEDAAALGEETAAEYWRRKQVFLIDGPPEDQIYQIDRLIKAGRAARVFSRFALRGERVPTEALVRLFDATLNELARAQTAEEVRQLGLRSYHVRQFLDELRKRADLPREELARREYQALPLLGPMDARGLTIHEFMAEDPNFFVDVLCDVFLPAHRDKTKDAEPTPEVQARAQAGFTLLEGMTRIPGQREENQINEEVLVQWINAVRKKAAEVDRAIIADQKIGAILAHASEDPKDSGWPHQNVRNVIEKLAADEIEQGLMIERYNMRGVVTRALYEGGIQERALASQYRGWADISRARWPRMARVLEMMAQSWEDQGRREDVQAEQEKLD